MNKKEIKFIIINKIKKIEMEVEDLKLLTQPIEPENSIGRISRMDAINNKSINDRMLRKAQEKLHNLKLNLKSINNIVGLKSSFFLISSSSASTCSIDGMFWARRVVLRKNRVKTNSFFIA